jgi:molybdenum cofactor cytidylyltransferase
MNPTRDHKDFVLGAVILAAGASTRMGRPKLLLPWGETTVVGHLIRQWQQAGAKQIAVVCAAGDSGLEAELDRLGCDAKNRVRNPNPERGMFGSIQCAARWPDWRPDLTHWMLVLGDQPHLRLDSLRLLFEYAAGNPRRIVQPIHGGRPRHPVCLPRAHFTPLAHTTAETLKDHLKNQFLELDYCAVDDPGLDLDLDSPADYQKAVELYLKDA